MPGSALRIDTHAGAIEGSAVGAHHDVRVFRGIPYAAPPVGDQRWRRPVPAHHWSGVREAHAFGPSCPQPRSTRYPTSEDCLFLNVWTAARSASERRPVMVWIHGGWFVTGSGSSKTINGEHLARRGAVVVTFNYRLGVFGFLAHPELTADGPGRASGNDGLWDMLAALEWVRANIDRFGGDPSRVTLFGESAGASAVAHLLTSPRASGLFHRAIVQSAGTSVTPLRFLRERWQGVESAESIGARFVSSFDGYSSIGSLRHLPADALLAQQHGENPFRPIVDGEVLTEMPRCVFDEGRQLAVPLLVGCNADEGGVFMAHAPELNAEQYDSWLGDRFGEDGPRVGQLYPGRDPREVRQSMERLRGDDTFLMNARALARRQSRVAPAFLYRFTRRPDTPLGRRHGAYHEADVPYVFGTRKPEDASGASLSEIMMAYWIRFAETGNPNGGDRPEWPSFNQERDQFLELGHEVGVRKEPMPEALDIFERQSMRPLRTR